MNFLSVYLKKAMMKILLLIKIVLLIFQKDVDKFCFTTGSIYHQKIKLII